MNVRQVISGITRIMHPDALRAIEGCITETLGVELGGLSKEQVEGAACEAIEVLEGTGAWSEQWGRPFMAKKEASPKQYDMYIVERGKGAPITREAHGVVAWSSYTEFDVLIQGCLPLPSELYDILDSAGCDTDCPMGSLLEEIEETIANNQDKS